MLFYVGRFLDGGELVGARYRDGMTALHLTGERGHQQAVQLPLDFNAVIMFRETSQYLAAKNGHVGVVHQLLDRGDKVSATTDHGETALHVPAIYSHQAVVRTLLRAWANTEVNTRIG